MNKNLIFELKNNGIVAIEDFFSETDLQELKSNFSEYNDNIKIDNNLDNLRFLSPPIYKLISNDKINNLLIDYLNGDIYCSVIHFTLAKVEINKNEQDEIDSSGVCAFHHDDCGKQLKINILLSDLEKDSNCLQYALKSHKLSLMDTYLLKFLNFFSFFKNWDKHFLRNFSNKFIFKIRNNFMYEKDIINKFKVQKFYGKIGTIYIFDTNGYHRQFPLKTLPNCIIDRKLLTLYFTNKKKTLSAKKD